MPGPVPRAALAAGLLLGVPAMRSAWSPLDLWPRGRPPEPALPSPFTLVGEIGRGGFSTVFRASAPAGAGTQDFALKQSPAVGAFNYDFADQIERELRAYVELRRQAAADGLGGVAHTVEFYGCYRSASPFYENGTFAESYTFLLDNCVPDAGVRFGVFWFQLGLEGASLDSYMDDPGWRWSVMAGVANSPVPVVPLQRGGRELVPPGQRELQLRVERRVLPGLPWARWEARQCHIGNDGGLYAGNGGDFQHLGDVTSLDVADPAKCRDDHKKWCFDAGEHHLRTNSSAAATAWVQGIRSASVLLRSAQQRLPLFEARRVIRDMLLGLREMHRAGIVHADVKPGNLLVPTRPFLSRPTLRWADMGFATWYRLGAPGPLDTPPGATPQYAPPELLAAPSVGDATDITPAYDVFGVGLIAFELLAGGSVRDCTVDNGKSDVDALVKPPSHWALPGEAYNNVWSGYFQGFELMHSLLQLLQVLGMPEERAETLVIGRDEATGDSVRFGNPYSRADRPPGLNESALFLERAIFAVQAATPDQDGAFPHAAEEGRDSLKTLRSEGLSSEKYGASKLERCAEMLLARHGMEMDGTRRRAFRLVRAMLQIWPKDRISVTDALTELAW